MMKDKITQELSKYRLLMKKKLIVDYHVKRKWKESEMNTIKARLIRTRKLKI